VGCQGCYQTCWICWQLQAQEWTPAALRVLQDRNTLLLLLLLLHGRGSWGTVQKVQPSLWSVWQQLLPRLLLLACSSSAAVG
jgi:hypothetical protein